MNKPKTEAQVNLCRISSRQQDLCAMFYSSLVRALARIYSRMLPSTAEKTQRDSYRLCRGRPCKVALKVESRRSQIWYPEV